LIAAVLIVALGVLVWLVATENPASTWLVGGAWAVLVVAMIVRAVHPGARGHPMRAGAALALHGVDEVQGMLLGRPDVGAVSYGAAGPPETVLVTDRVELDPADLSRPDHRV